MRPTPEPMLALVARVQVVEAELAAVRERPFPSVHDSGVHP